MSRRAAREAASGKRRRARPASSRSADTGAASPGSELETVAVPADGAAEAGDAPRGGILALIRKHPTTWLVSAIVVAFVGLGTGAIFTGIAVASGREEPVVVETEEPVPPRPLPETIAAAAQLRSCSVDDEARSGRLKKLYASAVLLDSADPEVLFSRSGGSAVRAGSVMKVFTAAAAIAVMGPDYRITTSVVEGSVEGSIVLIGRGDATLSALPSGQESFYPGAPKLADLAAQTIAAHSARHPGVPITQLVLDANYWNPGDNWESSWASSERTNGYHSKVTALQVDGDRADPRASVSPRGDDPVDRAGRRFIDALRAADPGGIVDPAVTTTSGSAASGSTVLGEVRSQPVSALVKQMLLVSDNTLAEMLARVTSKRAGLDGSSSSLRGAIPSALSAFDVDTDGMVVVDGSGLSADNKLRMRSVAEFMGLVWDGARGLSFVRDGLSVAGETGSLRDRFTGGSAEARGHVSGKTGWITTAYSLAGVVEAEDGALLAFSISAVRDGIESSSREAIDELVTAFYRCGSNLANF